MQPYLKPTRFSTYSVLCTVHQFRKKGWAFVPGGSHSQPENVIYALSSSILTLNLSVCTAKERNAFNSYLLKMIKRLSSSIQWEKRFLVTQPNNGVSQMQCLCSSEMLLVLISIYFCYFSCHLAFLTSLVLLSLLLYTGTEPVVNQADTGQRNSTHSAGARSCLTYPAIKVSREKTNIKTYFPRCDFQDIIFVNYVIPLKMLLMTLNMYYYFC